MSTTHVERFRASKAGQPGSPEAANAVHARRHHAEIFLASTGASWPYSILLTSVDPKTPKVKYTSNP